MCGIFGLIIKPNATVPAKCIRATLTRIAIFSESRGKDSSGMAIRMTEKQNIQVIKGDIPIHQLLKSKAFDSEIEKSLSGYRMGHGFSAFGHARLVTNGSQLNERNNQPVLKDGILVIHNGIIVNLEDLWQQHPELTRDIMIDTEIIPALIRKEIQQYGDLTLACNNTFKVLEGTFSIAAMFNDLDQFVLATNNGSLYYITDNENYIAFASEEYFIKRLKKERCFTPFNRQNEIIQILSNHGLVINMSLLKLDQFDIPVNIKLIPIVKTAVFSIEKHLIDNEINKKEIIIDPAMFINQSKDKVLYELLEYNIEAISKLNRCTKCLLPETFPYINYDVKGVCNYCNNYIKKNQPKNNDELYAIIDPFRNNDGKTDCLVPYSGGRDSTYSLHYIKRELGLNPIAFTYDWGMVTDLARRNAARVCGKLGIEHIIVAADIRMKRENIRKNVSAWLKKPHLGMVPIFMAGDKYFFHYTNKILRQTGLKLSIWGANPLENTNFKTGFTGIKPIFDKKRIDDIKSFDKLKLALFFGKQYLTNPGYFNSSLIDTLGSYKSRYFTKRHGDVQLFDYLVWEEKEIEHLIISEYKWEKSIDTKSTWRIGDGTAAFYNYIYYTVAGFSEFDTFRSNQIREGQMTRKEGLALVNEENIPRYENLRWYIEIIGLDFTSTIKQINKIPKLYNF